MNDKPLKFLFKEKRQRKTGECMIQSWMDRNNFRLN